MGDQNFSSQATIMQNHNHHEDSNNSIQVKLSNKDRGFMVKLRDKAAKWIGKNTQIVKGVSKGNIANNKATSTQNSNMTLITENNINFKTIGDH
jgi:hypothetical protein